MLKDYNSNWCPEVYKGMFVNRVNNNQVSVAPCCQADPAVEHINTFEFATSHHLQQIRQKFDQNIQAPECHRCWHDESLNKKSRRLSAIEFFSSETATTTVELNSLDYNATWACNLTCIMCGPNFSSSWAKELKLNATQLQQLGKRITKPESIVNQLDLTTIKKIHFNGGEPFINNDHTVLLEKLDQLGVLKNIFISYNTNGTLSPNKKTLDLWSRAKLVKLFYSIDATNNAFEYIRYPASWEKTQDNMLLLKQNLPSNVMFGFNSTVACYNLFEMIDVWQWFDTNLKSNREQDPSDFCCQFASNFDIKHLQYNVKQAAYNELKTIPALDAVAQYIKKTMLCDSNNNWITTLDQIDARRNTDWKSSLAVSKYI